MIALELSPKKIHTFIVLFIVATLGVVLLWARDSDSHQSSIHVPPSQNLSGKKLENPYKITKDFVSQGKKLFQRKAFCAGCHGPEGTGNGMESNPYKVKGPFPVNFTDSKWQTLRSDGEIFLTLKEGSRGTDMAPFLHIVLTEIEAWQIVAYIRTFKPSQR